MHNPKNPLCLASAERWKTRDFLLTSSRWSLLEELFLDKFKCWPDNILSLYACWQKKEKKYWIKLSETSDELPSPHLFPPVLPNLITRAGINMSTYRAMVPEVKQACWPQSYVEVGTLNLWLIISYSSSNCVPSAVMPFLGDAWKRRVPLCQCDLN